MTAADQRADLRGAGLARHLDPADVDPAAPAGARSVDHAEHAVVRHPELFGAERQRRPGGLFLPEDQRGDQVAARGNPRGHHRQLQRRDRDVPLADRRIERIRRGPLLFIAAHLPRGVRHRAVSLRRAGQLELLAQPKQLGRRRDRIVADPVRHAPKIGVAAVLDRAAHIHQAVDRVAAEKAVAQLVSARAVDPFRRLDALLQQRQAGHRFQGGAGRIQPAQRLVEQRDVIILVEHFPLQAADPAGKRVGIERGHRHQRQDRAGHAIDHHHRGGFQPAPARGEILQPAVDGQLDRFAGHVVALVQIAHEFAAGGHFDPLPAGRAAQHLFELLFQPVLADLETRGDQQRIALSLVILGRGRADIARQMADRGPGRIPPGKPLLRNYAGHVRQPHQHLVILVGTQP